ncbi:MAG: ChbG/HpnK family deacetylase [Planctomycetes bacterium]|nr:ChbG/HpnK family deacetylase [Planctomycetota bacterium]MBL7042253.1 ChbG/HpnK family deacetylase [Pirellulaceae bacterium]
MPSRLLTPWTTLAVSLFATIGLAAEQTEAQRYLIIHADDAGMCHSANRATIEAMEQGIVSSASIMVPCPWFPEIAQYAKEHPERDFGVHLTLTSEWKLYRWGPITARDKVPSLVDEQGFLWANVSQVARNVKVEEAEIELRAQIDRAIKFGVPITHLDTHMGAVASRPDLIRLYVKIGIEYDIPVLLCRSMKKTLIEQFPHLATEADEMLKKLDQHNLPVIDYLPIIPSVADYELRKATYLLAFKHLRPGVTQFIIHCGNDDPELQAVTSHAASRDLDRRVFQDPGLKAEAGKLGIKVISWKQLREMNQTEEGPGARSSSIPWNVLEKRTADGGLLSAYRGVMRRPLEYFGISIWSGPEKGGGYMGALAHPSTVKAGGINVFAETEVVETEDNYRELADLGINFLPFTHTLFSPADGELGFYTYDEVKRMIGFLEKHKVSASAYFGLANHPGFPLFTLDYAREDPSRYQVDAAGRPVHRVFPMGPILNPALSWEHPDVADGAVRSAAHHAKNWKGFANVPFWCLMGENLFADKTGDFSEAHRRHFAAWLKRRYESTDAWSKAWNLKSPKEFADAPSPTSAASGASPAAQLDMARFRRESMAELYGAVRRAVRAEDPQRLALGLFHGSADQPGELVRMGIHPDRIALATDGIASSHILWPNTEDPRNLVNLSLFRSLGRPVVVPIFGLEQDKVINDFTSSNYKVERIAQRAYEHMGMGVWGLAVGYWKVWGWTLAHHEEGKREIARLAAELQRLAPESELMQPVSPAVGLVIGADDAALDGMAGEYKSLVAAAKKIGLPLEFVYEERLLSGRPPVPRVLVVAGRRGISPSGFDKLREHVRQDGAALFWPTGDAAWIPSDLASHSRVDIVERDAKQTAAEIIGRVAKLAGAGAIPVCHGDGCTDLESFALTDGVNAMVIAINTADHRLQRATIQICEDLVAGEALWTVSVGADVRVKGRQVDLSLDPHGVAVLFGQLIVPESWNVQGECARLQKALDEAASGGFDTSNALQDIDAASGHLQAGRTAKALACLLHARRTFMVRLDTETEDNALTTHVHVASLADARPDGLQVELRLPDHGDLPVELERMDEGKWKSRIERDERLAVYDYRAGAYRTDPGPIAVRAEARAGVYAGVSPITMWVRDK